MNEKNESMSRKTHRKSPNSTQQLNSEHDQCTLTSTQYKEIVTNGTE